MERRVGYNKKSEQEKERGRSGKEQQRSKREENEIYTRGGKEFIKIELRKEKIFYRTSDRRSYDPWDIGYKILKGHQKNRKTMEKTIKRTDGTFTKNLEETEKFLLDKYFPKEEDILNIIGITENTNTEIEFTKEEVEKVIDNLNTKKATAKDGLTIKWLKETKTDIIEELTETYNGCLRKGEFPEVWR